MVFHYHLIHVDLPHIKLAKFQGFWEHPRRSGANWKSVCFRPTNLIHRCQSTKHGSVIAYRWDVCVVLIDMSARKDQLGNEPGPGGSESVCIPAWPPKSSACPASGCSERFFGGQPVYAEPLAHCCSYWHLLCHWWRCPHPLHLRLVTSCIKNAHWIACLKILNSTCELFWSNWLLLLYWCRCLQCCRPSRESK